MQQTRDIDTEAINTIRRITGVDFSSEQEKVLRHHGGMCILACAGSGKALKNGTLVLTAKGYKPVEELNVGDIVYNEKGEKQKVLGVFPQGQKRVNKVTFSNGHTIPCCNEHLWAVSDTEEEIPDWKVLTTQEIKSLLNQGKHIGIPYASLVSNFGSVENEPVIDPYIIGLLAAYSYEQRDSRNHTGYEGLMDVEMLKTFSNPEQNDNESYNEPGAYKDAVSKLGIRYPNQLDSDIVESCILCFENHGLDIIVDQVSSCFRVVVNAQTTELVHGFYSVLKELGTIDDNGDTLNYIPNQYLLGTTHTRLEVLRGIIDKSSYIDDNNSYIIPCKDMQMASSVLFLIDTLGIRGAYLGVKEQDNSLSIIIPIYAGMQKLHSIRDLHDEYYIAISINTTPPTALSIESITETDEMAEMTCIKVSGLSELFLTERCIATHNTTIVTNLIAKRLMTSEIANANTLLCTTYSKSGAEEMETRLNRLLSILGINKTVSVKTLHAVYLKVLREFGYPTTVVSERDRRKMLREVLKDLGVGLDDEEFRILDELLSYQVNNLLSDAGMIQSYVYTLKKIDLEMYTQIRTGYNRKKINAKVIDFDDMQLYMYSILCNAQNEDIIKYCKRNWTDIYVDEAQDMSKIQYAILRKIISDPNRLVVIGDDDQCIYQWRGADPSIILNVCADYDIDRMVLSTNYRCPANIVDKAAVGVKFNTTRSEKSMVAYKPGGKISVVDCGYTNLYEMSKYAYEYIRGLVENEGVSPDEIAILSRNNNQLILINNMLFKQGIHCTAGAEMKMTKYFGYYDVRNLLDFAKDTRNSDTTTSCIGPLCRFMSRATAIKIGKIQSECGIKTSVLLYILLKYGTNLTISTTEKEIESLKIPSVVKATIQSIMEYLGPDTKEDIEELYSIMVDPDIKNRAINILNKYVVTTKWKYKNNIDKGRTIGGLIHYMRDLLTGIGYEQTRSYLKTSERYDDGSMAVPGAKVCMSTMHGAKGREWEHVILFADDNVSFPSFQGINIQKEQGIKDADIYYGIDEGRRLHYVAMTRARKELTIFTSKHNPGMYMLESFGLFNMQNNGNDTKIVSMALDGVIDNEIIEEAEKVIFNQDSEYLREIDVSNVNGEVGDSYVLDKSIGENNQSKGFSLDDMETGPIVW